MALALAGALLGQFASEGLSAGIGVMASNASTRTQYKYQSRLQEQAARLNYEYGLKSLENSPTSIRTGLTNAGYNPMLAVQNATSGANAGWTNAGQAQNVDYSQAISNALDFQRVNNETTSTDSTVKLNQANSRYLVSKAISNEIHNKYLDHREQKELGKLGAETDKLIRETSYFDQLADNMEAERRLQEMGINFDYNARLYGADKSYNATKYASDVKAETERGTITSKGPFGVGYTKYYSPDDVIRKPHRGNLNYYDSNDRKYWRNYY